LTRIPLVDLAWQHREIADEVRKGLDRVVESGAFILGPEVRAFEEEFARASGVAHCIGVANGTDALELAVRALGLGAGDEVIVPANTFIASALAVVRAGAQPVFVDCDPETHLLDVRAALARVGPATRAVMAVNLFGQIAPIGALRAGLASLPAASSEPGSGSRVAIIEDAAQSQGAHRFELLSGSLGDVAGTSFYPAKNLGAWGDAGAVLTGNDAIAARVRVLRQYGSEQKYHHPELGFNSRLDSVQAVVLRAKLARLDGWNALRREAAGRYDALLAGVPGLVPPTVLEGNEPVWHLYSVRVPRRDAVLARLQEQGIEAGIHYPVPIHLQGAFAALGHRRGDFPNAERAADELLSLPLYPGIRAEQQERVAAALRAALVGA
jgi:dTDP-4-amino-4,6-dideoxygalactose transaminase